MLLCYVQRPRTTPAEEDTATASEAPWHPSRSRHSSSRCGPAPPRPAQRLAPPPPTHPRRSCGWRAGPAAHQSCRTCASRSAAAKTAGHDTARCQCCVRAIVLRQQCDSQCPGHGGTVQHTQCTSCDKEAQHITQQAFTAFKAAKAAAILSCINGTPSHKPSGAQQWLPSPRQHLG
jgi:hypothetical protein